MNGGTTIAAFYAAAEAAFDFSDRFPGQASAIIALFLENRLTLFVNDHIWRYMPAVFVKRTATVTRAVLRDDTYALGRLALSW